MSDGDKKCWIISRGGQSKSEGDYGDEEGVREGKEGKAKIKRANR